MLLGKANGLPSVRLIAFTNNGHMTSTNTPIGINKNRRRPKHQNCVHALLNIVEQKCAYFTVTNNTFSCVYSFDRRWFVHSRDAGHMVEDITASCNCIGAKRDKHALHYWYIFRNENDENVSEKDLVRWMPSPFIKKACDYGTCGWPILVYCCFHQTSDIILTVTTQYIV